MIILRGSIMKLEFDIKKTIEKIKVNKNRKQLDYWNYNNNGNRCSSFFR